MVDDGGRKERAAAVVAVQQLGTVLCDGLADAVLEQVAARSWITVPTSVSGSRGSPALSFFALASTLDEGVGDALDHDDALHRRAALARILVAPATASSAALSRSASSMTISGSLPPSSSTSRL